jgi:hypothetical protein
MSGGFNGVVGSNKIGPPWAHERVRFWPDLAPPCTAGPDEGWGRFGLELGLSVLGGASASRRSGAAAER